MAHAQDDDLIIRPHSPDDDSAILTIRHRSDPDFPPLTLEMMPHVSSGHPDGIHSEQWVAVRGGRLFGYGRLMEGWWLQASGANHIRLQVDPECWGQGIGSRLYDHLLGRAFELGAQRLYGEVREDLGHARDFARRRGFAPTGRSQRMSRLDVCTANLDGYEGLEEQLEAAGLCVMTLAELDPDEDFRHALHDLDNLSSQDIPSEEPFAPMPYDYWLRDTITGPGMSPRWSWVVLDGEKPVGLAFLRREGERAAFNSYTGVHPAYRGRGIARTLKLRTIQWARETGVDYLYTGNDIANQRMLGINVRLGYQPLPSTIQVVKHLEQTGSR